MVVIAGLEVVGAVAAVNALRKTERAARISESVTSMLFGEGATEGPETDGQLPQQLVEQPLQAIRLPALMVPPGHEGDISADGVICCPYRGPCRGIDRYESMLEQLAHAVPRRYGDTGAWYLLHSTSSRGTSLSHLLRSAAGAGPCVLLIRDSQRRVFGAYVTELRESHRGSTAVGSRAAASDSAFFGSGETFLFALGVLNLPAPPDERARREGARKASGPASPPPVAPSPSGSVTSKLAILAFHWTKKNDHFICVTEVERSLAGSSARVTPGLQLAIGAGGGGAGLMLAEDLTTGSTGACETFSNPPLTRVAAVDAAPTGRESTPAQSSSACGIRTPALEVSRTAGSAAGKKSASQDSESEFFECETVELWGVDEAACRRLPLCKDHVELRPASFPT
jgi:hypothetical protein